MPHFQRSTSSDETTASLRPFLAADAVAGDRSEPNLAEPCIGEEIVGRPVESGRDAENEAAPGGDPGGTRSGRGKFSTVMAMTFA